MLDTIKLLRAKLSRVADSQGLPLYDEREVRALSDMLLEEVCGITRTDRLLHPDRIPTADQRTRLKEIIVQMEQGIPVQQALGYAWFYGERFKVSPDVLIPRPETAELVDWIVDDARSRRLPSRIVSDDEATPLTICDVGTGSGCIAISLARVIEGAKVLALDVSAPALNIARTNSCQQHVDNLQFVQIDILSYVDNMDSSAKSTSLHETFPQGYQHFDIIVSNPPYVCRNEASAMSEIVLKHEPALALFVPDDDPLRFYRAIARFGQKHLNKGGSLYFEINTAFGQATCQLLEAMGYSNIELRADVTGRDRMIKAVLSAT
ncbi:MAG: peptide chain release factor N(5)-glutamine methyltransferase [Bacteroidales bacterium]|nr:peptide chain release factor N(5)-glutamine methyltransferase [Bacteroidales bacterium]